MTQPAQNKRAQAGKICIALSFLLWGAIGLLPFLEIPNRIMTGSIMYAGSYILFFIGGYYMGKDALQNWKQKIKTRLFSSHKK